MSHSRQLIDLTEVLRPHAGAMDREFRAGAYDYRRGGQWLNTRGLALTLWDDVRERYSLSRCHPSLLTPPGANAKLDKAEIPSYGLTLQHHVQRVNPKLVVNACPHAGHCVKVCVLDNGNGGFHRVQMTRRARTAFLAEQPRAFSYLLGWELAKASHETPILFRPNVNSDVKWHELIPSMFDGKTLPWVTSYGYTKWPDILDGNGWITPFYRISYSWNEKSDPKDVSRFLDRGGSVAVVSSRKKGAPVPDHHRLQTGGAWITRHDIGVDADLTDEWIFQQGVIGDLSAKGRARRLIGKSGFVVTTEAA